MSAPAQIVLRLNWQDEDVVDREVIREVLENDATAERAAQAVRRDPNTIKRRMGEILFRLLKESNKA